jgi:hypothetical protein
MRKDAALPAVVAAVLLLLVPAAARAGTYDVVACGAPGGDGINRAWTVETYNSSGKPAPPLSAFAIPASVEKCAAPGVTFGSAVAKTTVKADDGAAWTFHAPAGTTVKSVSLLRFGNARASLNDAATAVSEGNWWTVIARAGTSAGGSAILGDLCSGAAPIVYPGYCSTASGAIAFADVNQPVFSWGVQCVGITAALCFTSDPAQASVQNAGVQFQGARVTVEDLVAPDVGSDAGAAWRRSADPVTARAADSSGIRSLRVLVDGAERASERYACDSHLAAPCPGPAATAFDFAGVADGRHAVTVVAEDAASNVAKTEQVVDVDGTPPALDLLPIKGRTIRATVSDAASGLRSAAIEVRAGPSKAWRALKATVRGGRMSASVSGASRMGIRLSATDQAGNAASLMASSMSLRVRVGKHTGKVRDGRARVSYGRDAALTGRLTTTDGAVLPRQPLTVTSQLRRTGGVVEPFASAVTDDRGRFSIPVPAGPSRNLTVSYGGSPSVLHRVRAVSLRVPAASTIHASDVLVSGAAAVRFSGRLRTLGAALPAGGKLVDLQASQHGRWTTVATTRATATGWRAVARFRGTPGRYPVRLRIRREAVFPYDLGYSPSVIVRVR